MIRKLNRIVQDFLRPKRLALGKFIWDRKKTKNIDVFKNGKIDMTNVKSILFLRYDGKIGDMVVNTLMFREIKRVYPNIKVAVVARGAAKDIIKNNPYVDKIYEYRKGNEKKLGENIANENYDILIDFSELLRINQMKFINFCKAKINIGLDKENWNLFDISILENIDYKVTDHITKRYGAYLKKLGIQNFEDKYDIFLGEQEKYKNLVVDVVLNPYGASKHKHFNEETLKFIIKTLNSIDRKVSLIYSPDKYKELLKFVNENKKLKVELVKDIKSILDSSEIIKKSKLVITPDTSIVHIGSAFNKNIISVYPPRGGKYGVDHLVWSPLSKKNKIIFCKDIEIKGEEIDINTFDNIEMKNMIEKILGE